jgi:hypothetical protein
LAGISLRLSRTQWRLVGFELAAKACHLSFDRFGVGDFVELAIERINAWPLEQNA